MYVVIINNENNGFMANVKTKRVYTSEDKVKVGIISSPKLDIFHMGMENSIISIE